MELGTIIGLILAAFTLFAIGFMAGVYAAGRTIVPLYTQRIHFLELHLARLGVELDPSVEPVFTKEEEL
jgi:hypothetical protein